MPVKGQMNKTRTAKSKGKGLKLKWWYILPVIAIVAVAGYAIVRYSQASSEAYVKTVDNGGIKSNNPFYKYYKQGYGNLAVAAPNAPVFADFRGTAEQSLPWVCAVVRGNFVDKGTREMQIAPSRFRFRIEERNLQTSNVFNDTGVIRLSDNFKTVCRATRINNRYDSYNRAAIISSPGKVFVYRMFLTFKPPQGSEVAL